MEKSGRRCVGVVCLILGILFILPKGLPAKEKSAELKEIVISANKIEEPADQVPQTIDRITSKQIEDQSIQTVTEALRDISGLDVNLRGPLGDDVDLRIRGSDRDEVLILLDGIPIHSTGEAKTNFLNLLPVENIERIEVLKGSQSILYGSDAVGGVISIISKRGKPGKHFSFQWEVGNLSTFKETLHGSGGSDKTLFSAAFSRIDQGGSGPNDRLGSNALSAILSHYVNDDFAIELGSHFIYANQELKKDQIIIFNPTTGGFNDYVVNDSNSKRRFIFTSNFAKVQNRWNDVYESKLTYGFTFVQERILNSNVGNTPVDETGAPLTPNSVHFRSNSYRHDLDFLNNLTVYNNEDKKLSDIFQVGFNLTAEHLDFINNSFPGDTGAGLPTTDSYPGPGEKANRQDYAIYFQNIFKWKGFTLTGGMRFDHNSTFGDELSPRVSIAYHIEKTNTTIHGTYSEGFHAPVIAEFFDATIGGTVTSIPIKLQQELSQSYEAGVKQYFWDRKVYLRAVYFFIDYDRMLDIVETINDASSWGIEIDGRVEPLDWLTIGGNYTYNRTHNDDDGTELTMRPRHRLNAFIAAKPFKGFSIRADVNRVSSRLTPRIISLTIGNLPVTFFDSNGRTATMLPGYVNLDLSVRYEIPHKIKWIKDWVVFARGENLLDDSFEESFGFPMPGIQVYGGTKLIF